MNDTLTIKDVPLSKDARVQRGPLHIAYDITYRCNMRCLHCFNLSGERGDRRKELSDEEVIRFLDEDIRYLKPYSFCFCGGEPFLRESLLYEGFEILRTAGIKASLVTNGLLLTRQRARRLRDVGVYQVQVSLDGSRASTHEQLRLAPGSFQKALHSIDNLRRENIRVGVAFTPTKFNIGEIEDVVDLVKKRGVGLVRIQPLMILGRALPNQEKIVPTPYEYRTLIQKIQILNGCQDMRVEWGDPVEHLIHFRNKADGFCPFVTICADGNITVSPYLPLSLGNIRKHSLKSYWDAGLGRAWSLSIVRKLARRIRSVPDFGKIDPDTPTVFYDDCLFIDLIDENPFEAGHE
ncbi:MAG: radical SAM protein [Gemmatimonadota bacterium]|nr:MAG: radical SAM protein [Gemmatimonadota bacterium]